MRFIDVALGTALVSAAVPPIAPINYQHDVCKVLANDSSAVCYNKRHCIALDAKWWDLTTKDTNHYCNSKAVYGLEDEYEDEVMIPVNTMLLHRVHWAARRDCSGFVALFGKSINDFMAAIVENTRISSIVPAPAVGAYRCAPADLVLRFTTAEETVALEGILKMYSMFPFRLEMDALDAAFITDLNAAKSSFPMSMQTETSMTEGGSNVTSHASKIFGSEMGAVHWLLLRATHPLGMSFQEVMDLIIEVHGHLLSAPAGVQPKPLNMNPFATDMLKFKREQSALNSQLRAALGGLHAVVLKMVHDMQADTDKIGVEYNELVAARAAGKHVPQNLFVEITTAMSDRKDWVRTHYKSILTYFIYQSSKSLVSLPPRVVARWNV